MCVVHALSHVLVHALSHVLVCCRWATAKKRVGDAQRPRSAPSAVSEYATMKKRPTLWPPLDVSALRFEKPGDLLSVLRDPSAVTELGRRLPTLVPIDGEFEEEEDELTEGQGEGEGAAEGGTARAEAAGEHARAGEHAGSSRRSSHELSDNGEGQRPGALAIVGGKRQRRAFQTLAVHANGNLVRTPLAYRPSCLPCSLRSIALLTLLAALTRLPSCSLPTGSPPLSAE